MLICLNHFFHKYLGNSKYYTTFINDFNRKSWIYFLITKSQAFSNFKIFKGLVDKNEEQNIKVLRSNREGELLFNEWFLRLSRHTKKINYSTYPTPSGCGKKEELYNSRKG
jgi:hypothetical protein